MNSVDTDQIPSFNFTNNVLINDLFEKLEELKVIHSRKKKYVNIALQDNKDKLISKQYLIAFALKVTTFSIQRVTATSAAESIYIAHIERY